MISCLALIPRGAAKETPEQQELSAEEMEQLIQKQAGMSMQEMVDRTTRETDARSTRACCGRPMRLLALRTAHAPLFSLTVFSLRLQNETGEDEEADAAPAGDSSDAEMDDEEKKAEAEEPLDDKEAQLLKELKMGQSNVARE